MKYIKLSEICDLQNGYAFKSTDYVDNSNTMNCRMSNIRLGAIFDLSYSPKYLPDDFAEKYSDYILNDDDIVIAMTDLAGDPKILGVPAQVVTNGKNVLLNQRVGKLILKNKDIDFRYLKYNLSNPKNKEYYKRFSGGGLQINISKKDLLNLEIPLHEKKEQLQIANKLDNIHKLIDIRKEEIEKCNEFIKSQFVEMFGTIKNNKYNYETKKLSEVFEMIKDGTHSTPTYTDDKVNGIKFLSAKDVTTGKINWSDIKYIPEELHEVLSKRVKPRKGDILLCKNGTTGICAKVDVDEVFDIYVSLALLRPNPGYNVDYLVESINSFETRKQFNSSLKGIGVPNLHLGEISKAKILVPPIELQNEFAQIVEQIDKQKFEFEKSLKKLEELKSSLMQEYFG